MEAVRGKISNSQLHTFSKIKEKFREKKEKKESFEIKIFVDWCLNEETFSATFWEEEKKSIFDKLRIQISDIAEKFPFSL